MKAEITRKQSWKRRLPTTHLSVYITCVRERVKLCLAETCEGRQSKLPYYLSVSEGWTDSGFGNIPVWRVVEFRRVCGELLSKGRQCVVIWRTTGRRWISGLGDILAWPA